MGIQADSAAGRLAAERARPATSKARSVRTALLWLVLVTLVPLALASGVIAWQLWHAQAQAAEESMRDTANALSLAVDREISGAMGQLDALAASSLIDEKRWAELHGFVRSIAAARPGAVVALVDSRGQLQIQSNSPPDARLPNLWEIEGKHETTEWEKQRLPLSSQGLSREVFGTGTHAVSGLYISLSGRRPVIGLSVPVRRDGNIRFALVQSFPTESLERFLGAPDGTALRLALLDRSGVVIAKSLVGTDPVGSRIDMTWLQSIRDGHRVKERFSADGVRLLSAYTVSELTGWTVRASQPLDQALAPARNALLAWSALFVLVLVAAVGSAVVLGQRITEPLVQLTQHAGATDSMKAGSGIREIDVLRERLARAAESEQERRAEFQRRTEAEEGARAAAASERQVREREEELRIALEAGGMGTWRVDASTGKVRSDARHKKLWDIAPDRAEIDATEIQARMHPEDAQAFWSASDSAAPAFPNFDFEFRVRTGDGGWRWLAAHGKALVDADGRMQGMVGVNFDITERRAADDALRESEERFRQLTDNVDDVFWISEYPANRLIFVSSAYERAWGLDRNAVYKDRATYLALIHPEDAQRVQQAFQRDGEHGRFDVEYRVRTPAGERWVHDRCFPLRDADGKVYRLVGAAQEVTERKRSEAALAQLAFVVESVGDAIISMDLSGRVQTWNPAAERMYQWPAGEAIGRPLDELVEELAARRFAILLDHVKRGDSVSDVELLHLRRDGGTVQVSLSLALIRVASEATGVAATIRDITARKLYELKLRQHMAELEAADRRKDHFLAMLGHELRNPLSPILNSARLIRTARNDAQVAENSAVVIERQVEHLTRLIDDLLDVARITEGKIVLKKQRVDLVPLLYQAVEATRGMIEARGHALTILAPSAPMFIEADAARIVQILTNLLNNAAKYTPNDGRLKVAAEIRGEKVMIRVRDNGIGIDAAMLPRLFIAFAQLPEARSRAQGGLGIGLALVKRLVEMHGGTVMARSSGAGQGSEFTVTLPLAAAPQLPESPTDDGTHKERSALHCIVVDDNVDAAESMVGLLQSMGHIAFACYDADSALDACARSCPDLAILDIGLPGMDGYELATRLRSGLCAKVPYLAALTGYGQPSDAFKAREAGFDQHLIKPLLSDALDQLIGSAQVARMAST